MEKLRDKAFLNVAEVAEIMGISKSLTYEVLHDQNCPFNVVRIRSRYVIPANSFFTWYDRLEIKEENENGNNRFNGYQ